MTKYYLTVGINKYPTAPLNGCVNDAKDWSLLFDSLGYGGTTILDGDATKRNILSILQTCTEQLKYRDTLVVQYSGHGSWVPDQDGDEPDGRDEVWCAYDFEDGGLIRDDDIHNVISQRAFGSRVIMLSDSCFSGSVHRFAAPQDTLRNPGTALVGREKIRFMPPSNFLVGEDLERAKKVTGLPAKGISRRSSVLISGCSDYEYSYDAWIGQRYNGAFTYHAIRAFRTLWADGASSSPRLKDWYSLIRNRITGLPNDDYPQTPQLGGTTYQKYAWRL